MENDKIIDEFAILVDGEAGDLLRKGESVETVLELPTIKQFLERHNKNAALSLELRIVVYFKKLILLRRDAPEENDGEYLVVMYKKEKGRSE